jgi:hypothetical protein
MGVHAGNLNPQSGRSRIGSMVRRRCRGGRMLISFEVQYQSQWIQ